jgi:hypothetical protein
MKKTKLSKLKPRRKKTQKTSASDWNFGEVKKKEFKETPAFDMYVYGKTY